MSESQSSSPQSFHRATDVERGGLVRIVFDGRTIEAYAGESVAAALLAAGIRTLRASPRADAPRGAFCWMGICQECVIVADGVRRPACRLEVRDGMVITPGTVP
ncbi:(2Fe-2S)-binding protein [Acidisoma cellulosilytica]|uniref:(2Fe-2S)-binding protein n=1 Tax=Acidisoma cellulosilyticum TaxID=2802395 RepID=A0A964E429_9PROT|nr:(2Fe-2S)-binding protein [Acidisoma cellulosilyticum]MCB8881265.1 (2Fe-2S)-binding protein [Acidisoma cellulosilyticum]